MLTHSVILTCSEWNGSPKRRVKVVYLQYASFRRKLCARTVVSDHWQWPWVAPAEGADSPLEQAGGADGRAEHQVELHGVRELVAGDGRLHVVLAHDGVHLVLGHAVQLRDTIEL